MYICWYPGDFRCGPFYISLQFELKKDKNDESCLKDKEKAEPVQTEATERI